MISEAMNDTEDLSNCLRISLLLGQKQVIIKLFKVLMY